MTAEHTSGERPSQPKGPSFLEWLAGAIGALLALGILGFIAVEALDESSKTPPLLQVVPSAAVKAGGLYVVEVKVINRSGQTAAAVQIEGELMQGRQSVETSNASVDFVPGHSERTAGLIFSEDPRVHQLQVRATGYEEP